MLLGRVGDFVDSSGAEVFPMTKIRSSSESASSSSSSCSSSPSWSSALSGSTVKDEASEPGSSRAGPDPSLSRLSLYIPTSGPITATEVVAEIGSEDDARWKMLDWVIRAVVIATKRVTQGTDEE